jgi:hypothetical protein
MLNFTHIPCETGGERVEYIASKLKNRTKKLNHFKFLLSTRLGQNTKYCTTIDLKDVNDFPRMSIPKLKDKLYFGGYYLKRAKSYVKDIKRNSTGYSLIEHLFRNIKNNNLREKCSKCKIVACQISSGHQGGLKTGSKTEPRVIYRVYVVYLPNQNSSKSIIGNIFSSY